MTETQANLFYDANVNMTSDGTHSYTWDGRNQLAKIDSGATATFSYDPFGRRVSKTVVGTTTGFLYDGANPVQELSGSTPTANLLAGFLDEYFTRTDSSGPRHFLSDALGSSIGLTDSSAALQTMYTYEPFGSTTTAGSSSANSLAYTGREQDATGLYFYRSRYYDPRTGRFLSEDPLQYDGGNNFYRYVGDWPTQFTDGFGLQPQCKSCGIVKAPEYDVNGSAPGGTTFHWSARFKNDDRFHSVSGALHPGYDEASYKSKDNELNVQFSFGQGMKAADIDQDLYQDWRHGWEVISNHATNTTTNQDTVRKMMIARPEIGITPSTDQNWNRPQQ